MMRISTGMTHNDMRNYLMQQMRDLNHLQFEMGTGRRINTPADDPTGTAVSMMNRNRIHEVRQYVDNIGEGIHRLQTVDTTIADVKDRMDYINTLAIQAANSTFSHEDRLIMAREVDEQLQAIMMVANQQFVSGEYVFSGHDTDIAPFRIQLGMPENGDRETIIGVVYQGDIGEQLREIEQRDNVAINVAGNRLFWATNQASITRGFNTPNDVITTTDQQIRLDGKEILIPANTTLEGFAQIINDSNLALSARVETPLGTTNQATFIIETTSPHEIWAEDINGGTLLQDLSIIQNSATPNVPGSGPQYFTTRLGQSLFDTIINLRDNMLTNNVDYIGSQGLGNMEFAFNNISRFIGEVGAKHNRLNLAQERLVIEDRNARERLGHVENIDFEESIMNMKMLQLVQSASLNVGARILQPTLLDFLR